MTPVVHIRSEFKIKLKNMNKNTMVIVSRVFIFYDFSTYPPLRRIHLLHRSSQRLKAAANSSTPILLVTPSQVFLSVSGINRMPAAPPSLSRKGKSPPEPDPASTAGAPRPGRCWRQSKSALRRRYEPGHYPSGKTTPGTPFPAAST